MVSYTDAEYDTYLQHAEWTRQETDHLFDLCRQFECRFIVIYDRYAFGDTNRTIDVCLGVVG